MSELFTDQYVLLTHLSLIYVSGPDAEKFLNGQLTVDIPSLPVDKLTPAAVCNHKGRVVSNFLIAPLMEGFALICPKDMTDTLSQHLAKYAVFYKTNIDNISEKFQLIGSTVEKNINTNVARYHYAHSSTRFIEVVQIEDSSAIQQTDNEQLISKWRQADICDGLPWISPETIELFIPQHINLPWINGVNFKKGCYTGQEIVTRMHYKGKLKRFSHLVSINEANQSTILSADKLFDKEGNSIGQFLNIEGFHALLVMDFHDKTAQCFTKNKETINLKFSNLPYSAKITESLAKPT